MTTIAIEQNEHPRWADAVECEEPMGVEKTEDANPDVAAPAGSAPTAEVIAAARARIMAAPIDDRPRSWARWRSGSSSCGC